MNRKHIFIVNPIAGQGKSIKIAKIIDEFCKEKQVDYQIMYTRSLEESKRFLHDIGDYNNVYSVGGDGTLKEVVNCIVGTNNILNVIPAGSGNDFNKSLESLSEEIQTIDLGIVNKHYFINIASIGLDAEIANNVELMKRKNIPDSMIYNASVLYSLLKRNDPILKINGCSSKITLLAICNGKYYGHGFKIAPEANMQDGLFDIYTVRSLKNYQIPGVFLKLMRETHEDSLYVDKIFGNGLDVESDRELLCNVDGEIIKDKKFKFRLIPNAIKVDNRDILGIKKLIKKM